MQLNRDYENLQRLDVGGSRTIEEPNLEEKASDRPAGTSGGSGNSTDLQKQVAELKGELAEAKEQLKRLMAVQEQIARHVLPADQVKSSSEPGS